jgi:hypothetical protein
MPHPTLVTAGCAQTWKRQLAWAGVAALAIAIGLLAGQASAVGPYPALGSCSVFPQPPAALSPRAPSLPTEAAWNQDISKAPRDPRSAAYIAYIDSHGGDHLHPDFGSPRPYGFLYSVVGAGQRKLPIHYTAYGDESDPGPFPVPPKAPVEGGNGSDGDRHVLVVDRSACKLYELYRAFYIAKGLRRSPRVRLASAGPSGGRTQGGRIATLFGRLRTPPREVCPAPPDVRGGCAAGPQPHPHWNADSGTEWDLRSAARRPEGWTSADAAGLPIFPGLVRYDEVAAGHLDHAIRVTFESTRDAWVHPASHCAGDTSDPAAPPMGLRLRLKAAYGLGGFSGPAKTIALAMKRYGLIVADNGSNWFFSGSSDRRWNDSNLDQLKRIPGSAFEVVKSAASVHSC